MKQIDKVGTSLSNHLVHSTHDSGHYSFTDQRFETGLSIATYGIGYAQHFAFDFFYPQGRLINNHIYTHVMDAILHFGHGSKLPSGGQKIHIDVFFTVKK
jgi:hypothetical protein